jgi:2-polyprenyl-6-methoxyphenol hydroxylase-like FAD-dependent oxidoreductase
MQQTPSERRKGAVVIGGSMAGLLAARVLTNHFSAVTIIERDQLVDAPLSRRGVPQGRHTHGLLAGGKRVIDALFPGISAELIAAGALASDIVGDSRWFMEGGCHTRFRSGLEGLMMSRPMLESTVRSFVRKLPGVRFLDGCETGGLVMSPDKTRVVGLKIGDQVLAADLVVDTAGRGSHSPEWLESAGYPKPHEERVEVGIGYTTRAFRRNPDDLDGDKAVIIAPTPAEKRGGVMLAQEGGRWTVTIISHFGLTPPADLDGFLEFARRLPAPFIYDVISHAEPVGEAAVTRFPASVRRHYEKLERFPEGFLVMGDAISSFNPIYGQGMSAAALESVELDAALADSSPDLARRFFRRAAKVVDTPWSMAVGNDLRMPEVTGRRTLAVRIINAYLAKLHKAAHQDEEVALAFHRVGNLLAPPASVLHPRIALRVLRANLGQGAGLTSPRRQTGFAYSRRA